MTLDVLVVGTGPAGLAVAAALSAQGMAVACLDPAPDRPWRNTFAVWTDEVEAGWLARSWSAPIMRGHRRRVLARGYGRLDNQTVFARLSAGIPMRVGTAAAVRHDRTGSTVVARDGTEHRAAVVVDASGHGALLLDRPRPTAFQTAYGVRGRFGAPPVPPGGALVMDWTAEHGEAGPPTFLYGFDEGEGVFLAEETALAARPALGYDVLRRRLTARLAARGTPVTEVHAVEKVRIPLDVALPRPQRVVGFGAAAGLVHPATGYSVAAALRLAPPVAHAVVTGLAGGGPVTAAAAGWAAVWPARARLRRAVHSFGLEALLGLPADGVGEFFDAFFALPEPVWAGYLDGTGHTAAAMSGVFARVPGPVRRRLLAGAVGRPGYTLARSSAALAGSARDRRSR